MTWATVPDWNAQKEVGDMGATPCAAKIILCSPPVAHAVAGPIAEARAIAELALTNPELFPEEALTKLLAAVEQCESYADKIETVLGEAIAACVANLPLAEDRR